MAYGDYIDASTLLDDCDSLVTDTPGKNPDCKFIGQMEGASTAIANRPHLFLARNSDELKARLDAMIARTQVSVMAGISGPTFTIDPTGGAADISFSAAGYLYMGNGNYSGAVQEDINTLFQLLDENYNEVTIDGEEVVIQSVAVGPAIGSGFYNGGQVTLQLSASLPVGTYRLAYARDTTLATMPDDALIAADIRGLHEAAAESQSPNSYVCAIDTTQGPADFVGATAVSDALANLPTLLSGDGFTLCVRAGSYIMPATWPASADDVRIVGRGGRSDVTLEFNATLDINQDGVILDNVSLEIDAGEDLTFSGDHCGVHSSDVTVDGVATGAEYIEVSGDSFQISDCTFADVALRTGGRMGSVEGVAAVGFFSSLWCVAAFDWTFRSCSFSGGTGGADVQGAGYLSGGSKRLTFDACGFYGGQGITYTQRALNLESCEDVVFNGCRFVSYKEGTTNGAGISYSSNAKRVTFNDCDVASEEGEVVAASTSPCQAIVTFNNCKFSHTATVPSTLNTSFAVFRGDQVILDNCEFYPGSWDPNAGTEYCLWFDENVHARNTLLDLSGQASLTVDYEWFVCEDSIVDGMTIDQGLATTIPSPTGLANRLVRILGSSEVQGLKLTGIGGDMVSGAGAPTLVEVVGSTGTTAVLDGLFIETRTTAPLWAPASTVPAVCLLAGGATVRRLFWDDQEIEPGSVVQTIVGMEGSNNLFEKSLVIVGSNNDDIRRCFLLDGENGAGNRILDNELWMTPLAQSGPAGPFYQCAELGGASAVSAADEKGQLYGQFNGNTLRFFGYPQDNGSTGYMIGGPLVFQPYIYMWAVDHNVFIAKQSVGSGTNPINQIAFFHEGSLGFASGLKNGAGGCSFTGNILRAAFSSTSMLSFTVAHNAASPSNIVGAGNVAGADETTQISAP